MALKRTSSSLERLVSYEKVTGAKADMWLDLWRGRQYKDGTYEWLVKADVSLPDSNGGLTGTLAKFRAKTSEEVEEQLNDLLGLPADNEVLQKADGQKVYEIPVRFSGRIMYQIPASSEDDAKEKAEELAEEADCGQLEDIDWDVKDAVSIT